MKDFHFSCGNSTRGAVGLAGSVRARNRADALRKLRRAFDRLAGPFGEIRVSLPTGLVGYVNVYVSPENIRKSDIDGENHAVINECGPHPRRCD